jgi:hypothetical protein
MLKHRAKLNFASGSPKACLYFYNQVNTPITVPWMCDIIFRLSTQDFEGAVPLQVSVNKSHIRKVIADKSSTSEIINVIFHITSRVETQAVAFHSFNLTEDAFRVLNTARYPCRYDQWCNKSAAPQHMTKVNGYDLSSGLEFI